MLLPDDLPLHVGDRLRIVCPEVAELCVERRVGPDGSLDLPLVGPVSAAVRRPTEIARAIRSLLPAEGFPSAVEVRFLGSASGEIVIGGAVQHSLRLFAPHGIDRERLLAAAKPSTDADLGLVTLAHRVRPGSAVDVPSVSAERKISVLGGVAAPISLIPLAGLTLGAALEAAGGLTGHGDPNGIVVVRMGESIPATLPADVGFALRPGDAVRVGLISDRHYVTVRGQVARPGTVEYVRGMTILQAIKLAGGVSPGIQGGEVVWQTGAKTFRLSLPYLLERRIPDPLLGPEDTLILEAYKP